MHRTLKVAGVDDDNGSGLLELVEGSSHGCSRRRYDLAKLQHQRTCLPETGVRHSEVIVYSRCHTMIFCVSNAFARASTERATSSPPVNVHRLSDPEWDVRELCIVYWHHRVNSTVQDENPAISGQIPSNVGRTLSPSRSAICEFLITRNLATLEDFLGISILWRSLVCARSLPPLQSVIACFAVRAMTRTRFATDGSTWPN